MKQVAFGLGILLISGIVASAQESTPAIEIGANYSWFHVNSYNNGYHRTLNGGSGYFEYNLNKVVGLVGDFGGYANTNIGVDHRVFSYMFGPRFNWRHSRLTPYVQFLFGGAYAWDSAVGISTTQNGFASAAGGGLDFRLTRHIAFKPIQVEYVATQLPNAVTNVNRNQNNIRYSAGVVFQLGEK
jgi:hypothetical protein